MGVTSGTKIFRVLRYINIICPPISEILPTPLPVVCTSSVNNDTCISDMNELITTTDNDNEDMDCDSGAENLDLLVGLMEEQNELQSEIVNLCNSFVDDVGERMKTLDMQYLRVVHIATITVCRNVSLLQLQTTVSCYSTTNYKPLMIFIHISAARYKPLTVFIHFSATRFLHMRKLLHLAQLSAYLDKTRSVFIRMRPDLECRSPVEASRP